MLNYTTTSTQIDAAAGTQINLTTPTVTITITANAGYTVTSSDFSIGDPLPPEVASAVFSQAGDQVECLLTFDNSFIMPSSNVDLAIDIDGLAVLVDSTTTGTYEITGANLDPDSTSTAYTIVSEEGGNDIIVIQVNADAGYHFAEAPLLSFSGCQVPSDYLIFNASTTQSGGKIISYYFNILYNRGTTGNVTGDLIRVAGNAVAIFEPAVKYYTYSVPTGFGLQTASGVFSATPGDKQLLLAVYGDVGANITLDISKNGGASTNIVTAQPITFQGGYSKIVIPMTGAVDTDYYEITFSGDIDPSFAQPNPLRINIVDRVSYTVTLAPIPGYTITPIGTTSVSGLQGYVVDGDKINTAIKGFFKVTKDDGSPISLQLFPTWNSNVTNLDSTLNGGTEILYRKLISVTGNGTPELIIGASAVVEKFGNISVTSEISLTTTLNTTPVTTDVSGTVTDKGTTTISLTGNATDADGDTLTPIIVTQPVNGTVVVDGFGFLYTHTAENSNPDAFTYKVTDGYGESNVSTVNITVTGIDASTLTPSGGAGLYRVWTDVGSTASTIDVTFDAGTKPGRVQLIYSNIVVADTLFVGDNLTDANRATTVSDIDSDHLLYQYAYVGVGGNGGLYGQDATWNVYKPIAPLAFDSTDIASTGNVRTIQSNWDGQSGIQPAAGVDSADGNVVVSFTKPAGGDSTILVYVYGITGSDWDITNITVTP